MDPLYARYPFLADARAAVETADVDILDVVETRESPIVERALERIDGAIDDGRVPDPIRDSRVELLSYPIARVLVSLVDDPALTERYALAEARRGFDLYAADREADAGLRSSRDHRLSRDELLSDFGLRGDVIEKDEEFTVSVFAYLELASDRRASNWRLINRAVRGGHVPVSNMELDELLREAIRCRVGEDLPLDVPEVIADALDTEVAQIAGILADVPLPGRLDRVVPAAFPPCIDAAISGMREERERSAIERFAAISFLCAIGMSADEVVTFIDPIEENEQTTLRHMVRHIHGTTSSTAYPPPGCAAMEAAGGCVNDPNRCKDVGHPLIAYENRLEDYLDAPDWRASGQA